jgi:hypothetical protein
MVSLVKSERNAYNGIESITEEYRGLSTDTKPVLPANRNGSIFLEMDTMRVSFWDGENLIWRSR